jgi:GntR family transcriptional regulator, transcriptional repressor for pyruvate dehydrogenase complex
MSSPAPADDPDRAPPAMPDSSLQPIRRSPLYEEVVERLRAFIDIEELKPGDKLLSERELAQRLGVSRTSVRQALTALRVGGLVEIRHGDGVYLLGPPEDVVPSLADQLLQSHAQLPAIMEVREALETQTARLAARRRSEEDLRELRAALDAMAAAIEAGEDGADADQRFHGAIARAARNDLIVGLMDQLADPIDQTRRASLSRPDRPPRSLAAHHQILDAIERQDEHAAATAMREHLEVVADLAFVPHEDPSRRSRAHRDTRPAQ